MNKLNPDATNTLEFQGEVAADQTFLNAMRDGVKATAPDKLGKDTKGSRTRMKRQSRPTVPKTFGSRSK